MKIGIVANILQDRPFAEALDYFHKMGIQTIEPGCGGYARGEYDVVRKILY